MPVTLHTLTIPAGQSVSNAVNVNSERVVRIKMPDNWTAGANLTFELSPDGVAPYSPVFTTLGRSRIAVIPGAVVMITEVWPSMEFVRVRSGSVDMMHMQEADRVFILATDTKA